MRAILLVSCLVLIATTQTVFAEITTPQITSAAFDATGRLKVKVSDVGYEGCYITVNGGLSRSTTTTAIVSTQISAAEAASNKVAIKTRRKYFCRRRTLYVSLEKVCLGNEIGSANSSVKAVRVPTGNVRS